VAYRPPPETILIPKAATHLPRSQHTRCSYRPLSAPKTGYVPPGSPPEGGLAIAMELFQIDGNVVS